MTGPDWEMPEVDAFDWAGATPGPQPAPDVGGVHQPSHTEHYVHLGLDAAHMVGTIAEFYEMIYVTGAPMVASHGGVAALAANLAPVGYVATIVVTFLELRKAFTTTHRIQAQKGLTYGLMWGVLGVPDVPHTTRPGPTGGTLPLTQAERESWEEGVREGRERAKDPKVREAVERALAFEMAAQKRDLATDPQHRAWNVAVDKTLNRVWNAVHEDLGPLKGSQLSWEGTQDGFPKAAPKP